MLDVASARKNYVKANDKGLLKTFAKMGISTLQSYRGAQIFEAVGLDKELVARCFTGTASRVSGVGYDVIATEVALTHARAFPGESFVYPELDPGGLYQWRTRGERHTFNPDTVALLQVAVQRGDYADYKAFSRAADGETESACTLRGLFKLKPARRRSRSRRSRPPARSSSASAPAPCPTARSAWRRTRPWPSP